MIKKTMLAAVIGLGLMAGAVNVHAMTVRIAGDPCPLKLAASLADDAETKKKEVAEFELYGSPAKGKAAIGVDGEVYYVSTKELKKKLPAIPVGELVDGSALTEVCTGDEGPAVVELQKRLIAQNMLDGEADGKYGKGTARAVSSFQEAYGLPQTGNADVNTLMVLQMVEDGKNEEINTNYPVYNSVEEKFEAIISQASADLEPYLGPEWRFSYDLFENFGTIDSNVPLGSYENDDSDIDRIVINTSLKIVVAKNEDTDMLDVLPCLVLESEGAYRPYTQGAVFVAGNTTTEVGGGISRGSMDGTVLKEYGYVPLTQEILDLLATGKVNMIRIKGKNQNYDISVNGDAEKIAAFVKSCKL